jgi:hypothetical protein
VDNKKLHKCDHCSYETAKQGNLDRHINSIHMKTPTQKRPRIAGGGRKCKEPIEWSESTKKVYAWKERNEFNCRMERLGLMESIERQMLKDLERNKTMTEVTESVVINMISDFDLPDRKMLKILKRLRKMFGNSAFTPNIREALITRKLKVAKHFKKEKITFEDGKGGEYTRWAVYTEDLEVLLDFLCEERGVEANVAKLAIGMDSGQKRMLVTLSLMTPEPVDVDETKPKKLFKDSSNNRVIILAIVDDIPETYMNMKQLLEKLRIQDWWHHYQIVTDLKLNNIILGLTNCASKYGCPYCKGCKGFDGCWQKGDPRTLENIVEDNDMWKHSSGDQRDLKDFFNAKYNPLLVVPHSRLLSNILSTPTTLEMLPIPALHCGKLGPVNKILKSLGDYIDLEPFYKQLSLVKTDQQKKEFQGPECDKILRNTDELREYLVCHNGMHLLLFVHALDNIKEVYTIMHATTVPSNHREVIKKLENTWRMLMSTFFITMPLKIHILIHHLSEYFETTGSTLRLVTDQVVESAHHKVLMFFKTHPNYNIKDKDTEECGEALLRAVIHFNSNNLGSK